MTDTAFTSFGNEDLRNYVQNNWNYIALFDTAGNELLRRAVPGDADATWDSGSSTNPLRAKLTVTGQDIQDNGYSLPVTITRTESYKSDTATQRTSYDAFADLEIEASNDEVVLTHEFEIQDI